VRFDTLVIITSFRQFFFQVSEIKGIKLDRSEKGIKGVLRRLKVRLNSHSPQGTRMFKYLVT
jgi:hypothetical protein